MITRFLNAIKGFINKWIFSIELANPEMVFDNAITTMLESYQQLKAKAGAVIRRETELAEQKAATEKQLRKVTDSLNAAAELPESQVDLVAASEAIRLQEQLTEKLAGLTEDYTTAAGDSKDIKEALLEVESSVRQLKAEKNTEIGRYQSAKARIDIMEMQDGTSIEATRKSLEEVRGRMKDVVATAKMSKEMRNETLESKVRQFQKVTEGKSAEQKFQAMRDAARQKTEGAKALEQVIEQVSLPKTQSA